MNRRLALIIVVLAITGFAAVTGFLVFAVNYRPAAEFEAFLFTVEPGESFASVRARLADRGLVAHPKAVSLYAWLRGYDRRIHAGTYRIEPGVRPRHILAKLVSGDVYRVRVTIPEGYLVREIAGELARTMDVDSTAFASLSTERAVLDSLGVEGPTLEGYLFPDTYLIPYGSEPQAIAAMMVERLEREYDEAMEARAAELDMTRNEVLTLASIIEAETRLPEERTLVSAVYHNRLSRGMRLEADPTVAYAMDGYRGRLYWKHLEIDSPYNTYRNAGLPPGPICSPGTASIGAALYPDEECKAFYFVARGDGGHVFSNTLREHEAAVRRVRRDRDSSGGAGGTGKDAHAQTRTH